MTGGGVRVGHRSQEGNSPANDEQRRQYGCMEGD